MTHSVSSVTGIVIMVWVGVFRCIKVTAPVIGQLGRLVPSINSKSMTIPNMTHDSIEEMF